MGTIIDLSVLSTVQKKHESRCHAGPPLIHRSNGVDAGVIHSLPPKNKKIRLIISDAQKSGETHTINWLNRFFCFLDAEHCYQ